jgi:cell wall hydrolase
VSVTTVTTQNLYSTFLLALCAWREARGEPLDAQRGVIWTILNRAAKPGWWGRDIISVILCPYQFSSFNQNDPNATKFPAPNDPAWPEILLAAVAPGTDPTGGATSYYDDSIPAPSWAGEMTPTVKLGRLNFYR